VNPSAATIYVIDDEPDVCAGLSRLLRSAGWSALTFCAAQEFLDHVPTQGVGCILLDVNMPGMSGPELHERRSTPTCCLPRSTLRSRSIVSIRRRTPGWAN
jgi:FixJ family two-component response regulator